MMALSAKSGVPALRVQRRSAAAGARPVRPAVGRCQVREKDVAGVCFRLIALAREAQRISPSPFAEAGGAR